MKKTPQVKTSFIIQDNVLIGQKLDFSPEHANVGQLALENIKKHPDFVGQIDAMTGETLSYKSLADQSIRCAIWLKKQGILSGDIVCLFTENNIASWIPFLAIHYIGAVFNGGARDMSAGATQDLIKLAKPKIIFTDEEHSQLIKDAVKEENVNLKIVVFGLIPGCISFEDIIKEPSAEELKKFECSSVNPNDDAWLLYSSGSTGISKAVMYTYGGIYNSICTYKNRYTKEDGKVFLYHLEIDGNSTPTHIMRSILSLSPTVIARNTTPEEFCKILEKYKVQFARLGAYTAALISKFDAIKNYDLSSLNLITIGGDKIRAVITKTLNEILSNGEILQGCGMTEAGGRVVEQERGHDNHESVGFVFINGEVKVIDTNTEEVVGPNKVGELCYRTTYMMKCYYKNPKLTQEVFDSEGWLHSGDLGYFDEEGYIYFVERIKCVIKYKDILISAAEIENFLIKHPDVEDVAVVGVPHVIDGEHPIAFVTKTKNSKLTEAEIVQLSLQLGEHKKLRGGVVFLEELPRIDEKIHRVTLKEIAKRYIR